MGSVWVAAWVAKLAFVALVALGIAYDELSYRAALLWVTLGVTVWVGLPLTGWSILVTPVLAALDIALVFVVFKGDVRIT